MTFVLDGCSEARLTFVWPIVGLSFVFTDRSIMQQVRHDMADPNK